MIGLSDAALVGFAREFVAAAEKRRLTIRPPASEEFSAQSAGVTLERPTAPQSPAVRPDADQPGTVQPSAAQPTAVPPPAIQPAAVPPPAAQPAAAPPPAAVPPPVPQPAAAPPPAAVPPSVPQPAVAAPPAALPVAVPMLTDVQVSNKRAKSPTNSSPVSDVEDAHPGKRARKTRRTQADPSPSTSQEGTSRIVTDNRFAALPVEETAMETATEPEPSQSAIPPITIHDVGKWPGIRQVLDRERIAFKKAKNIPGQGIQVHPSREQDYRALTGLLRRTNVNHHVYHFASEKPLRVVIRGLPSSISTDEVTAELRHQDFPVTNVTKLRAGPERKETGLFYVVLTKSESSKQIYQLRYLFSLCITVEKKNRPTSGPRQCYNCLMFGHTSRGCFAEAWCVKCGQQHPSRECTKPREEPATCANCLKAQKSNTGHTASYRGCPMHPQRPQRQDRRTAAQKKPDAAPALTDTTQFPAVAVSPAAKNMPAPPAQAPVTPPAVTMSQIVAGTATAQPAPAQPTQPAPAQPAQSTNRSADPISAALRILATLDWTALLAKLKDMSVSGPMDNAAILGVVTPLFITALIDG